MYYAQTNYPNVAQGIPPTRYTLAQVGCFLTSFSNLLQRGGREVDPPTLNAYFRDNSIFIDVDDGVRDDVGFDTITKFDSRITVKSTGNGAPPSNNAIVKFVYNNGKSTHFCLVLDAAAGTIIDSWDGKVKNWSVYGGPKAYAVYNVNESEEPMSKWTNGKTYNLLFHACNAAIAERAKSANYVGYFGAQDGEEAGAAFDTIVASPQFDFLVAEARTPAGSTASPIDRASALKYLQDHLS